MLIKAYGEYWSRARVDWKNRNLHGVLKGKQRINAWRQRGIYALYDRFTIIYIGQAEARDLGKRLDEHRRDRFADRWDSFSWFGICELSKAGEVLPSKKQTVTPEAVIRSIELMAILLSNTPLNRARGKFPGSRKVWQRDTIHQKAGITLEQRVSKLRADLAELEGALPSRSRKTGRFT
jgi:hypothetical protein